MKKLLALVLALLMLCSLAFAAEPQTINLGDYNMTLDPDMLSEIYEKTEGQVYMVLYPNYDDTELLHSNINALYTSETMDLSTFSQNDIDSFAESSIFANIAGLENTGVKVTNRVYLGGKLYSQDDVPTVSFVFTVDVDFTDVGYDLQTTIYFEQVLVCVDGIGSYVFTITTKNEEELHIYSDLLGTITWNK